MNRFHVHLNVADLPASVRFYSRLFATEPAVLKTDYAKWMLEDPRVNFAISTAGRGPGIDHLGIQAESAAELAVLGSRLVLAEGTIAHEPGAVCCYAKSDKTWMEDPQGTRWEIFHTLGEATTYYASMSDCGSVETACGATSSAAGTAGTQSCCGPTRSSCC
ncbi:ArsI/CadI family heavy metal resistance metalloenzyme [Rudaea sp.]|uniref:ArsI/CadI family heavy metal resistance metalloenzyme n=1 Tax=Rudaea sp. TaxID=2136325 RepID=UPI00321F991E